jgi:FSR family fosmidomycin resistance protein-like MFS transporter
LPIAVQVGGNFGQSMGPLLAAFIVVPFGQTSILVFGRLADRHHVLWRVGWYSRLRAAQATA